MMDETVRAIAIYIRLVSYPIAAVGVVWLMISRAGWRTRPTSLIWLALAGLHMAQFGVVVTLQIHGQDAAEAAQNILLTPAIVIWCVVLWSVIAWLATRWRTDPAAWI